MMMRQRSFFLVILVGFICAGCESKIHTTLKKGENTDKHSVAHVTAKEPQSTPYDSGDIVTSGFLDASGMMWFATTKEGIFTYDGTDFTNYSTAEGLCGNQVWAILQDSDDMMWFGTQNGLCRYNGVNFETIPIPKDTVMTDWLEQVYPIVNPKAVVSLIQDKTGDFWIGSNGAGAYRYDKNKFTSYLKEKGKLMPDSLHHNVILSIVEAHDGDIWFSSFSHGGISQFTEGRFIDHALKDGFGDGMIASLYIDRKEHLWVGTRNGGIYKYEDDTFVNVPDANQDNQIAMATFLEDSNGTLWVASYARKGVYTYDGTAFIPFDIENSDQLNDVKTISEDKDGNIWFGGRYGLLWRFDGEELKDFTFAKSG